MNVPSLDHSTLEALCRALAADDVMTHGDVSLLLQESGIVEAAETGSKWRRMLRALQARQVQDKCGNNVLAFLQAALRPVRFTGRAARYDTVRCQINEMLALCGLQIGEDGKAQPVAHARTLPEAQARAQQLHRRLVERKVHPDVLRFCRAELLQHNYFHAVLEATKSVAQKLRDKAGLTGDGTNLVEEALCGRNPRLAINSLRTESEQMEQRGFANLLKGIFGMFRNPVAHEPKITWTIDEADALDLLTLVSLAHRRLDAAVRISTGS